VGTPRRLRIEHRAEPLGFGGWSVEQRRGVETVARVDRETRNQPEMHRRSGLALVPTAETGRCGGLAAQMAGGPHALTVPIDWGSPQAESPPQCPTSGAHWTEMDQDAERRRPLALLRR